MVIVLPLAVLVGVSLGLLGGGGSILTVPILAYVADMPTKAAIAASLFVVAITSAVSAVAHARAGRVRWRVAAVFAPAGMIGAYAGGVIAAPIPGQALMILFAGMMIATGVAMLRPPRALAPRAAGPRPVAIAAEGLAVGVVTGLVGAGGGFLVVPALVLLGGLPMDAAVGTSLVVIAAKSAAGLAGHLGHVSIDWGVAIAVTAAAAAGAVAGARLVARVPATALRRGFGAFVLAMAAVVLAKELL